MMFDREADKRLSLFLVGRFFASVESGVRTRSRVLAGGGVVVDFCVDVVETEESKPIGAV